VKYGEENGFVSGGIFQAMVILFWETIGLGHIIGLRMETTRIDQRLPSGKHTKNYGESPFSMGNSTINGDFQ
jgi:hypothetical protein